MALVAGFGLAGLATAGPAAASTAVTYFAYPAGGATSPSSCPETTATTSQCTLTQALGLAGAGDTVALAQPGTEGDTATYYVGTFSAAPSGTTAAEPLTIEPANGVTGPILDGNSGASAGCPTATCEASVLSVGAGVFAAVHGITVQHGSAGNGAGIFVGNGATLSVTGSTFASNNASFGGAISDGNGATLSVTGSTFTSNVAVGNGGAIDNGDVGGGFPGQNIVISGTLTVTDSTFSSNSAGNNGGAIDNGDSGGNGTLTVTGSTFNGNAAHWAGGAIANGTGNGYDSGVDVSGTLGVSNSTFSANTVTGTGGEGGAISNGFTDLIPADSPLGYGTLVVTNSTISGTGDVYTRPNGGATLAADLLLTGCTGPIIDGGYNLYSGGGTCAFPATTSAIASTVDLGPLQDNGGPTQTQAPLSASQAVDLIPPGTTASTGQGQLVPLCAGVDQRGVARPQPSPTSGCDVGSVELAASTSSLTASAAQSHKGAPVTLTATVATAVSTPALPAPAGTVDFAVAGAPITGCTAAALVTSGAEQQATCTTTTLPAGIDALTATYQGTDGYHQSSGSLTHDVGATWHVAPSGTDSAGTCATNSATNAFPRIQDALACAKSGDRVLLAKTGSTPYPGFGTVATDLTVAAAPGANARSVDVDVAGGNLTVGSGAVVTVFGVTLSGHSPAGGPAVLNQGNLTLSADTVTGNFGTGVENTTVGSASATLSVLDSTVSDNQGTSTGAGIDSFAGPGATGSLVVTIANSTLADDVGYDGGGLAVSGAPGVTSTATVLDSTLTANHADNVGGGIFTSSLAQVTLANTVVAANTATSGFGPDCAAGNGSATVTDGPGGHNLLGVGTGCPGLVDGVNGDQVGVSGPGLLALADYGGPTDTVALDAGSPAIGTADATTCEAAPTVDLDQRGDPRNATTRGVCDIGAYDTGGVPAAAPTVASISPTAGPLGGKTVVSVTGTGFAPGSTVSFGAVPSSKVVVSSATQLKATSPAGTGTVDVTVTTPGGTSATSSADQFSYQPAPTVTSLSPTAGPVGGGTAVTIDGTDLNGASAVTFGTAAATALVVVSPGEITVTAPAHAAGKVRVVVTTPGGKSPATSADRYDYKA